MSLLIEICTRVLNLIYFYLCVLYLSKLYEVQITHLPFYNKIEETRHKDEYIDKH